MKINGGKESKSTGSNRAKKIREKLPRRRSIKETVKKYDEDISKSSEYDRNTLPGSMRMPEYYGVDVGFATDESTARSRVDWPDTGVNEDRPTLGRITSAKEAEEMEESEADEKDEFQKQARTLSDRRGSGKGKDRPLSGSRGA